MPVVIYNLSHYLFRHNDSTGHKFVVTLMFFIAAAIQAGTIASLMSAEAARIVESGLLILLPSTFEPYHSSMHFPNQERTYITIANWYKAGCVWLMYLGAKFALKLIHERNDTLGIVMLAATFVGVSLLGYLPIG